MSGDLVIMIPYGKHHIDDDDIKAVVDILKNEYLTQGPMIEKFEKAICNYVGAKYAVAVSSGTAALHLSALAAGVKPGRSIVTSPITFVSTANASFYCGRGVHFADIDPLSINISPMKIKDVIEANNDICAIFPVHFGGLPCDMEALSNIAERYNLFIVEDAAHALGANYSNGQKVGSCCYSDMTIFSFHPVKSIAAGEGGLITTNDEALYRKLIRLRSHGINKLNDPLLNQNESMTDESVNPWYYEMQELGFHYRIYGNYYKYIKDKGELPITDERMTRFMISVDQGVELVWHALGDMVGGEIYIKKVPSMKITDIAKVIAPQAKHKIIGIRPGEKLHEQMISIEDSDTTYEYSEYYKILPKINNWAEDDLRIKDGVKVSPGFIYNSNNNSEWMINSKFKTWIDKNQNHVTT